jgi:hypothetical protein
VAYRQMSLLLRRPPGREAYPGDVGRNRILTENRNYNIFIVYVPKIQKKIIIKLGDELSKNKRIFTEDYLVFF